MTGKKQSYKHCKNIYKVIPILFCCLSKVTNNRIPSFSIERKLVRAWSEEVAAAVVYFSLSLLHILWLLKPTCLNHPHLLSRDVQMTSNQVCLQPRVSEPQVAFGPILYSSHYTGYISRKCGGCKYIDWKNTLNKSTFPAILAC